MHKNEPVKCYGFIMGYYRSFMHTLRNPKDHAISSRLDVDYLLLSTLDNMHAAGCAGGNAGV